MFLALLIAGADAKRFAKHRHNRMAETWNPDELIKATKGMMGKMGKMGDMPKISFNPQALIHMFDGLKTKMQGMDKNQILAGMEGMLKDGKLGNSVKKAIKEGGNKFSEELKTFATSCDSKRRMENPLESMMQKGKGELKGKLAEMVGKTIDLMSKGGEGVGAKIGEAVSGMYHHKHGDFAKMWKQMGFDDKQGKSLESLMDQANCIVAKEAVKAAGQAAVSSKHIIAAVGKLFENAEFLEKTFKWGKAFVGSGNTKMMGGMGGKMMMMKGKEFEGKMKKMLQGGQIAGIVNAMLKESGDKFSDNLKDFARQCKTANRRRKANYFSKMMEGMKNMDFSKYMKGMDFSKLMGGMDLSKMKGMTGMSDIMTPMVTKMMKSMMGSQGGQIGAMVGMMYYTPPGVFAKAWKMMKLDPACGQELEQLMSEANCMVAMGAEAAAGGQAVTTENIIEAVSKLFDNAAFLEKSFKWGKRFVEKQQPQQ